MTRPRFRFTPAQSARLTDLYPRTLAADLAEMFGCSVSSVYNAAHRLGLRKDVEFIRQTAAERMADPEHGGRRYCFQKGQTPANKGRKQSEFMSPEAIARSRSTCFKRGHTPKNHKPVGYERINRDGYIEVKIREPNVFKAKHRIVWEQHNSKIKPGYNVQFRDGDRRNFEIGNLYLISRHEQMTRNSGSLNLPDGMVAAYMSGSRSTRDYTLVEELKKHPELLDVKRKQLLLNREIKHGNRKSNADSARDDR